MSDSTPDPADLSSLPFFAQPSRPAQQPAPGLPNIEHAAARLTRAAQRQAPEATAPPSPPTTATPTPPPAPAVFDTTLDSRSDLPWDEIAIIRDEVLANYRGFLEQEIRMVGARLRATPRVTRLHWGGGTPSALESQGLASVLETLSEFFVFDPDMEHAIELDPRTVTRAVAHDLAALGINRVSLGVQDLDPGVQKAIGRVQPLDVVTQAVTALRDVGIDAINFDLMYALPNQTVDGAQADLAQALAFSPPHLSFYHLTLEPNTRFFKAPPPLPDEDQAAAQVKGRKRYEGFIETLGRRFASGKSLLDEIPEDVWPQSSSQSE